jgi:AcrR family transcriptional regulator
VTAAEGTSARPGRPRSVAADEAILAATTELFIELGYDALTVEQVAARAGVAKATIYRRYPSKVDLVIAAARALGDAKGPAPDTGDIRADLLALARAHRRMLTSTDAGRAIPAMIAARPRDRELAAAHSAFVAERRASSTAVLRRAIDRGELPAATDVELLVDLVVAPLFYRVLVVGARIPDRYLERLVDTTLRAFSPASAPG